jgi:hypothetical protein
MKNCDRPVFVDKLASTDKESPGVAAETPGGLRLAAGVAVDDAAAASCGRGLGLVGDLASSVELARRLDPLRI